MAIFILRKEVGKKSIFSILIIVHNELDSLHFGSFFRSKDHMLDNFSQNVSANVFNKSFVVYDPYPERRKIINTLMFALPAVALFACTVITVAFLKLVEGGFLLSLIIIIIGVNLIWVEGVGEIYKNSKTFTKLFKRVHLGVGDVKVLNIAKNALHRMVKCYLSLSIIFIVLSIVLPYVWSSLFGFSALIGVVSYQALILLFAVVLIIVRIFASKIKKKILNL